ncbi:MAG TPA: hypothetical protein PKI27_17685 [Dermatophilaceae bacterium]|nr:hypothetical protein [Dermatophilaceae bacterium]
MKTAYCPRCDRPFTGATKLLAWLKVKKHVKNSHPDYLPMIED